MAAGSLVVSLLVFGLIPALQLTRASLRERMAGDASGASPSRWKGRRRLIMWQVAISTALILLAAEVTKIVTADARHETGLELEHLVVGRVNLRPMHWDGARTQQAIGALDVATRTEPGFESMALATRLPLGFSGRLVAIGSVSTVEQPSVSQTAAVVSATPGIFRTLGVPILRGRGFDDQDTATTTLLIVISERMATSVFGTADVVGRQVRCDYLPDTPVPEGRGHRRRTRHRCRSAYRSASSG